MIGAGVGIAITTLELQEKLTEAQGPVEVLVDHECYEVLSVVVRGDTANTTLIPKFGDDWVLEVGREDFDEPMWELA